MSNVRSGFNMTALPELGEYFQGDTVLAIYALYAFRGWSSSTGF